MLHATFHIPVNNHQTADLNYSLNRYDIVVADEASLVLPESFSLVAATLNRLNCRPVVVISGDKKQQQTLQTDDSRVSTTRSILNDNTFGEQNAVKHAFYQQFRVLDRDYGAFLDLLQYLQPMQEQLDEFQQSLVLCPSCLLNNDQLFEALNNTSDTVIMIVLRAAAQRVNNMVVDRLFAGQAPLRQVSLCFRGCRPRCISIPWHEDCHNRKLQQGLQSGERVGCHPCIQPE